jgi:hypothetical protein
LFGHMSFHGPRDRRECILAMSCLQQSTTYTTHTYTNTSYVGHLFLPSVSSSNTSVQLYDKVNTYNIAPPSQIQKTQIFLSPSPINNFPNPRDLHNPDSFFQAFLAHTQASSCHGLGNCLCRFVFELHFAPTFQSYTLWNAYVADRRTGHVIACLGSAMLWLGVAGWGMEDGECGEWDEEKRNEM